MYTIEQLQEQYRPILSGIDKKDHRYWVFPIDSPSPFLPRGQKFSCGDTSISVIDHYHGRRPWLMNHDFACGREVHLQFIPTIILDSHMVSYLVDYANGNENMPRDRRRAVLQFLEYVVLRKYDYNPFYYWLEANKTIGGRDYIVQSTEAIFRLHNMDIEYFLATSKVRLDPRRAGEFLEANEASSLSHVAAAATADIPHAQLQHYMNRQAALSYTAILRIVEIQATGQKLTIVEKMRLFHDFVVEQLRISLARETFLAIYYFAGEVGRFIPQLQSNSDPDQILRRCQAAAWDLILLRLPEILLVNGEPHDPLPLAYVCTGERALQKLAGSWIMMHIASTPPQPNIPTTGIIQNPLELQKILPESTLEELEEIQATSYERLQASRKNSVIDHISETAFTALTSALEKQIRSLTRRKA